MLRNRQQKHTAKPLPVYSDTYKLVLEIFVSTKNFPKEYKYNLRRDLERDVLVLMRCIYRANRAQEKTTVLNEFLNKKTAVFPSFLCNFMQLIYGRKTHYPISKSF
ncbi:MAG: hypothetical protein ACOH1N_08190 [Lutibacter sp.]